VTADSEERFRCYISAKNSQLTGIAAAQVGMSVGYPASARPTEKTIASGVNRHAIADTKYRSPTKVTADRTIHFSRSPGR
jgi:hypothetical protein